MYIFYPEIVCYLCLGGNAGMTWWPADLNKKHGNHAPEVRTLYSLYLFHIETLVV